MSSVTFRQLKAFSNVVELGSFVAAAGAMHITPSALSTLIADLEQSLGFRLLDRTTRQVRLSAVGEQYLPYAKRVLQEVASANSYAVELRSQKSGRVRVAASQVIAWTLMPPLYLAFQKLQPNVQLEPIELPVDEILPSLQAGRADLAIIPPTETNPGLVSEKLFSSRVYLACRADHPWARRKSLRWAELQNEPLIFTGTETSQRINALLPNGLHVRPARQVDHAGTAIGLAASGFGSAICSDYVRPIARMHGMKMVALVEPAVSRPLELYTAKRRALAPAVLGFRKFVVERLKKNQAEFQGASK